MTIYLNFGLFNFNCLFSSDTPILPEVEIAREDPIPVKEVQLSKDVSPLVIEEKISEKIQQAQEVSKPESFFYTIFKTFITILFFWRWFSRSKSTKESSKKHTTEGMQILVNIYFF